MGTSKIKQSYRNSIHSQIIDIMMKTKCSMIVDELLETYENNIFEGITPEKIISIYKEIKFRI
jgi:hypothetical protein